MKKLVFYAVLVTALGRSVKAQASTDTLFIYRIERGAPVPAVKYAFRFGNSKVYKTNSYGWTLLDSLAAQDSLRPMQALPSESDSSLLENLDLQVLCTGLKGHTVDVKSCQLVKSYNIKELFSANNHKAALYLKPSE